MQLARVLVELVVVGRHQLAMLLLFLLLFSCIFCFVLLVLLVVRLAVRCSGDGGRVDVELASDIRPVLVGHVLLAQLVVDVYGRSARLDLLALGQRSPILHHLSIPHTHTHTQIQQQKLLLM